MIGYSKDDQRPFEGDRRVRLIRKEIGYDRIVLKLMVVTSARSDDGSKVERFFN
jgi:hypothetical protein